MNFNELDKILCEPLAMEYMFDRLDYSNFMSIKNNRTLVYSHILELKSQG